MFARACAAVENPRCDPPSKHRPTVRPPARRSLEPSTNIKPVLGILAALSFAHLLNDTMQSLVPAIYPISKAELHLDFRHIGLITLTNQLTASILQPFVGLYTDKRPQPFSLAIGMGFTLFGLILLSFAESLGLVLLAVAFVGIGSSVFHPEASRVAHLSSGGQHGFAQSIFQVGGNTGSSPRATAGGCSSYRRAAASLDHVVLACWRCSASGALSDVGRWYRTQILARRTGSARGRRDRPHVPAYPRPRHCSR